MSCKNLDFSDLGGLNGLNAVSYTHLDVYKRQDRLFVMDHSHKVMEGTPREVFAHAKELTEIGLAVPQVTSVLLRLRELGLPVDPSAYTVEQAVEALLALKGGTHRA